MSILTSKRRQWKNIVYISAFTSVNTSGYIHLTCLYLFIQDKLVEELRHALIADQDVLEQKQFVLDEKEIEILAKDEAIARLETENADLIK